MERIVGRERTLGRDGENSGERIVQRIKSTITGHKVQWEIKVCCKFPAIPEQLRDNTVPVDIWKNA